MFKNIKGLVLKISALAIMLVPAAVPAVVYAADLGACASQGADLSVDSVATGGKDCAAADSSSTAGTSLDKIIKFGINIFSVIVGVIAVVMIIIGGLKYITSGGDSGNITGAKNTILYAIIGLVVVALAQFIVQFVLSKTSASVTG